MINEENKIEVIELYLNGNLEGEMLEAFENRLQKDGEFRKLVALEKEVLEGLDGLAMEDLQKELDEIHEDEKETGSEYAGLREKFEKTHEEIAPSRAGGKVQMPGRNMLYWKVAAAVALLVTSGIIIFMYFQQPDEAVLAYVQVSEVGPDGNLARGGAADSLQVMIFPPTDTYDNHYQLSGILTLYGNFTSESLQLFYSPATDKYFLETKGRRYALEASDDIVPLE